MSDGTTTHNLPTMHSTPTQVHRPGDVNHWIIPTSVLLTVALWIVAVSALLSDHNPAVDTIELALFITTGVATVCTVNVVKSYMIHRANSLDHETIRDDIADLRILIGQVAARQVDLDERMKKLQALYWEDVAEEAVSSASGGGVVPLGRRRH